MSVLEALAASSASSAEVEIEISVALIAVTGFSVFWAFNRCSGCRSSLPPHQPPGALVAPANYFRGDVLRYWGGVTSIVLKCFPHLSHLKFAWGPCQVSASPTHVMVIPFRRVFVVALITLEFFQISVSLGSFDNLVASSASSAKVELEKISSPSSSAFWGRPPPGALVAAAN